VIIITKKKTTTTTKSTKNTNTTNTLTRRDEQKKELRDKLNSKQICFCHNYILDSSTAVEAYLTAYPGVSYDTARVNSTRLLNKPHIKDYINILLDEQQELIEITEKEIYRELKRIALTSPNENTRLKAIDQLVKLKGMVQTGDTTTNNTLIQIGIVDTDSNTATDINDMINNITYTVIDSPDDPDDTNQ
jgi:phage terminase small subunit